jgi:hypothetical protein
VLLSPNNAVLPKPGWSGLLIFSLGLFLLAAIFLVAKPVDRAAAVSLDDAISQLAERIASIPNLRGPVRLEIQEDALFDATEGPGWRITLRRELDRRKLSITEESAAPLLRVGTTETPLQIVIAADLLFADRQEIRVLALSRVALQTKYVPSAPVRVGKQLLFESTERIHAFARPSPLLSTARPWPTCCFKGKPNPLRPFCHSGSRDMLFYSRVR